MPITRSPSYNILSYIYTLQRASSLAARRGDGGTSAQSERGGNKRKVKRDLSTRGDRVHPVPASGSDAKTRRTLQLLQIAPSLSSLSLSSSVPS